MVAVCRQTTWMMRLGRVCAFGLTLGVAVMVCVPTRQAAAVTPDPATTEQATRERQAAFFEKAIRPVLVKHCFECHSTEAAGKGMLKAGLLLDTKAGLAAGGESGPAVVAGSPEKSLLIEALRYESYQMPPSGRLPASVVADFEKWVEMGAPDPRDAAAAAPTPRRAAFAISDEDRAHWSFQPVRRAEPPQVKRSSIMQVLASGCEIQLLEGGSSKIGVRVPTLVGGNTFKEPFYGTRTLDLTISSAGAIG